MRPRVFLLCIFLLSGLIINRCAFALEPTDRVAIEPRAKELLKEMGGYLRTAETFTFQVEGYFEEVLESGQKLQYGVSSLVAVKRPNGLYAERQSDIDHLRIWYDDSRITLLNVFDNTFGTTEVPTNIDDAFDHLAKRYGITPPLIDLVYSDPFSILLENVKTGIYAGSHDVRGTRCHHLAFTQSNIDWQIWIEDGINPVPRKIVITYKKVDAVPQFTAFISDWDFSPRLSKALFTFKPSSDARKVEFEFLIPQSPQKK